MSNDLYLNKLYYDPSHPASFSGVEKLYQFVTKEGKRKLTKKDINRWLRKQDTHTLYQPVKRTFRRQQIITSGVDTEWGIDLAFVDKISEYNENVKYLLFCIDIFSKFLFIEPLKTKTGKDVASALKIYLQAEGLRMLFTLIEEENFIIKVC